MILFSDQPFYGNYLTLDSHTNTDNNSVMIIIIIIMIMMMMMTTLHCPMSGTNFPMFSTFPKNDVEIILKTFQ